MDTSFLMLFLYMYPRILVEPLIMAISGGGSLKEYIWFGSGDLGIDGGGELGINANGCSTNEFIAWVAFSVC
jgi:hypothetical protein